MSAPNHPIVYEINTRCWLRELSDQHGHPITLDTVPSDELDHFRDLGFSHLWLMGLWPTGPRCREHALASATLRETFTGCLPDWQPDDIGGSPFAPAGYRVPPAFGGDTALRAFRQALHQRGLGLFLDFIPNHVGLDHPWLRQHPEYFVQSQQPVPGTFEAPTSEGPRWIAHGKDPNFPPWTDTAQLDYRRLETQRASADTLLHIARCCDGVRCDMAMLILNEIFASHWQSFPCPSPTPGGEFWQNVIQQVRRRHPGFLFLAEAYWDLEARLQRLGFNFTYDKLIYDHLIRHAPAESRRHVFSVGPDFLAASAHFLENHDEPRIASLLQFPEHRAAALAILGLPGLRLLHDGQLTGARTPVPVQLTRRPSQPADPEIASFYQHFLRTLRTTSVGRGPGKLLSCRPAWPDNPSNQNFLLVQWQSAPPAFDLVVVNLAQHRSQCYVSLHIDGLADRNWKLCDLLGSEVHSRYGDDLQNQGLYLDVPPHAAQLFHFEPQS